MNIEDLNKLVRAVTPFEWCGQTVYLRKLSAKDGAEMFDKISSLSKDEHKSKEDKQKTLEFHVNILSKCLSDADGNLQFDSDEGREALMAVSFIDITELGTLAITHSGASGTAKKNLALPNSQPTDSALDSDGGHTPTISSAA